MTCNPTRDAFAQLLRARETSDVEPIPERVSMSDAHARVSRMRSGHDATLDDVVEECARKIIADRISDNGARLHGLLAMLALPARRGPDGKHRRIVVEVEISHGQWAAVEDVIVDADGMTMTWGRNGDRVEYHFPGTECPRWRTT
jgi:hypothetical protein